MRAVQSEYREVRRPNDPVLPQVRRLYEATLDRAERVPWPWLARGLGRRGGRWSSHLIVAQQPPAGVLGFYYGAYLPGFAGYACYLGVDTPARGRGVGRRLTRHIFAAFRRDAARRGESLPFVIWESHPPQPGDPPELHANWRARLRLFARTGGLWLSGVDFRVPNYMDAAAEPVPLQLYLAPQDEPAEALDGPALRRIVATLYGRVYGQTPGDELYELAHAGEPRLRPVAELLESAGE